ncbi:MAG: zinc finger domain-containing protein [Planctomycetota bacterium]
MPLASLDGSDRFRIYGREHCTRCQGSVEAMQVASRKLYWCPTCQGV